VLYSIIYSFLHGFYFSPFAVHDYSQTNGQSGQSNVTFPIRPRRCPGNFRRTLEIRINWQSTAADGAKILLQGGERSTPIPKHLKGLQAYAQSDARESAR
jgi:hypothetical protein